VTQTSELLAGTDFTDREAATAVQVVQTISGRPAGHWYLTGGGERLRPSARPYRGRLRVRLDRGGRLQRSCLPVSPA
jgi:hypothetical protein